MVWDGSSFDSEENLFLSFKFADIYLYFQLAKLLNRITNEKLKRSPKPENKMTQHMNIDKG